MSVAELHHPRALSRAVPDAVAPPPRHPRFPLMDGLRALAVLAVVGVHAALMGGAFGGSLPSRLLAHLNVGVTIFFVISGFLLYRPMIAHRAGGAAPPATREFFKRRFLRIYPAYWLAVTVLLLIPAVSSVAGGNWWPMYALLHTLPVYNGARCVDGVFTCGLAQTWSLVVEVTFYAVLPVYALLLARLTRRLSVRAWMVCELLLLTALSALSVLLEFPGSGSPPGWISGSLIAYLYWFALGMGMAVASVALTDRAPRLRAELLWLLAAAIYVGLSLWLPGTSFVLARGQRIVTHLAFGAIAALMVAPAIFGAEARSLPGRLLANPIVAWLGLISYGIFLWHYAVALELGPAGAKASFWIVLAGTLALSVGCAAASYYVVERPLLRLKYRTLAGGRRWRTGRSPLPGPTHRARNPRA